MPERPDHIGPCEPSLDEVPFRAEPNHVFTPLPPQKDQLKLAQALVTPPNPAKKLPPAIPNRRRPMGDTLCIDDVRHFMFDRSANDNPLDLDLAFTDEDIQYAFRFTAMRYNAIQPQVIRVHPDHLPFAETMMSGVAYYLYNGKLLQLIRNDVDYSAGNMTIDINKRRIETLSKLAPMYKEQFEKQAKEEKVALNLNHGFMDVGMTYRGWGVGGGWGGGAC